MFAIITPALITGAFAERMKFNAFLALHRPVDTLVYMPIAHWSGCGRVDPQSGALDFAGGIVVHISSGIAALAAALVLGNRRGFGEEPMTPHNLPLTILGAGMLWFGWLDSMPDRRSPAGALSTNAFVVTHIAGATAALVWVTVEWIHRGNPTTLGAASGCIAGLAAITPASGFVAPMAAILIGLGAGIFCYWASS